MFSNRIFFIATTLIAISVGCSKAEKQSSSGVNLAEGTDLFSQPVLNASSSDPAGAIATVNGVEITAEMFRREVNARANMLRQRVPPEQLSQMMPRLRQQVLDQIIARILLLQEAERQGVTVTEEEMAEYRSQLEAALPPGLNLSELLAQRGISEEQFRREFMDDIRVRKMLEQAISNAVTVSDAEVQQFYEENVEQFHQPELATARHLLVAVREGQDKEAQREKALKLRERILAGEDFATVVREASDDPGSRDTGGLYTFPRGQMVPEFEEAAFTQPIGEVGDLVETMFGYHIIKVEKREAARDIPLEEVRTNVIEFLRGRKAPNAVQNYVDQLRQKAQIVIHQSI